MTKYRLLSQEELKTFKKEFIDYLVVNGLAAEDWESIKKNSPKKANSIMSLFSDVIFEGVFRKVSYLDYRSKSSLKSFQCLENKMVLVSLDIEDETLNLLDVKDFNAIINNPSDKIKVYTTEKEYSEIRELELFKMVSSGCEIADGTLFKSLCLTLS